MTIKLEQINADNREAVLGLLCARISPLLRQIVIH